RTIEVTSKFKLTTSVIINKFDLNTDMANEIEAYCNSLNINVIAQLPFDRMVVDAMVNCKSIVEFAPDSEISTMLG
ncbi:(4Fe-4S)-binding protein, partial [bacterium]|nr:(4Fe-4S)-binding protein [bacterium]